MREFLYVDDMASAAVHVMNLPREKYEEFTEPMLGHLNVGYGSDVSIANLSLLISKTVGYDGRIVFDVSKPDGAPRKWMDSSKLRETGWTPMIDLPEGIARAYKDFISGGSPKS